MSPTSIQPTPAQTVLDRFSQLWHRITTLPTYHSHASIGQRQRAGVLQQLIVAIFAIIALVGITLTFTITSRDELGGETRIACIACGCAVMIASILNRSGLYRLASSVLLLTAWLAPYVVGYALSSENHELHQIHWAALTSIMLMSILFPKQRMILGIGLLNAVTIVLLHWVLGELDATNLFSPMFGSSMVTICTMVIHAHRTQLERERKAELVSINDDLTHQVDERERLTQGLTKILGAVDALMTAPNLDILWKQGIELARDRFGIDRCSIWEFNANTGDMMGTYATDATSKMVPEHNKSFKLIESAWFEIEFTSDKPWAVRHDVDLREAGYENRVVGKGWNACTAISNRNGKLTAALFSDNAISGRPFDPLDQDIIGVYCSLLSGIVERKRAEMKLEENVAELRIAKRMAEESSRTKSEFLSTVSHELRTPLNAIIGFSDMLLMGMNGALNQKQHHKMSRLRENGVRLLTLINNVLDLNRLEARRVEIVNKPFSPRDLVTRIAEQMEVLAQQKNLQLGIKIDRATPNSLLGDEQRVEQVIVNLLSNAFKFTDTGAVTLMVDTKPEENTWRICVVDTGIGIPPHALNLIFEEFRQVDGSSNRAYKGSGLGLSITRNLVHLMRGHIAVDSKLGTGSTFTIVLPLLAPVVLDAQPQMPTIMDAIYAKLK